MRKKLIVACFPHPNEDQNPYLQRMYSGLGPFGINVVDGARFNSSWLSQNKGLVKIIHFHWPSYYYSDPSLLRFTAKVGVFTARLVLARILGYKIIWTIHNLFPHEMNYRFLHFMARFSLAQICDAMLIHFEGARSDIKKHFFRQRRIYLVPHPNYIGEYPNSTTKGEARRYLGLSGKSFVYLVFGLMRRYKGLEEVIAAFKGISSPDQNQEVLVIAGNDSSGVSGELRELIGDRKNIHLYPRYIPNDEVSMFFNAADAVVLPYRKVYTSGIAILALSFGKLVVAPRQGGLPELINDRVGLLFDDRLYTLEDTMKSIRMYDADQAEAVILTEVRKYDGVHIWPHLARILYQITGYEYEFDGFRVGDGATSQ